MGDSAGPTVDSGGEVTSLSDLWSERDILAEAQALGHTGAWAWHVPTGQLWWSDEMYRIFGLEPQEFPATYEVFLQHVHPDDRDAVNDSVDWTIGGADRFSLQHRVIRPDGEVRHVHSQAAITRADDGTPLKVLGALRDTTEEHETRRQRDAAVEALAESEELYRLLAENAWDVI